jgi:hypothetical protein
MSELKDKIVSAIKSAQEKGITLVKHNWGSKNTKCACPLGCVLIANEHTIYNDEEDNAQAVAELLDVSEDWVTNFIYGFDGDPIDRYNPYMDAWNLGYELRHEIKPINHTDYVNSLDPMAVEFVAALEIK